MYKLINLEKRIADLNLDINLVLQATQISDKIYNEQKRGVGSLSKDEINRLADYLDCTPEYLMGKSDIPFPGESVFVRTPVKIEEHNRLIKDGYKPKGDYDMEYNQNYENYKIARDRAWKILIRYNVNSLPVDVFNICKKSGVLIYDYIDGYDLISRLGLERYTKYDGFTVRLENRYIIFYNNFVTPFGRIRFTLAHEIGHIALKHLKKDAAALNKGGETPPNNPEMQANIFAARLLAPACVLHEIGVKSAEQLQSATKISLTAAKIRFDRLQELRKRNAFYKNPYEIEVYKNFKPYINEYKLINNL